MRGYPSLLGFLLMFASATTCWAESGATLYETEVEVEDQSPEQREQAIRKALDKVLEQVAGERGVTISTTRRKQLLRKAERYVQQYGYTEQGLWVRFDRRALDELLQEQGAGDAAATGNGVLLKVNGVRTLADYVRVVDYLAEQKFARGVQPVAIEPEAVLLQLMARGAPDAVIRAIGRDGFLQWMSDDAGVASFLYSP